MSYLRGMRISLSGSSIPFSSTTCTSKFREMAGQRIEAGRRTMTRCSSSSLSARKFQRYISVLSTCLVMLVCQCTAQTDSGTAYAPESNTIGINYGMLGDNLLPPAEAVARIKAMNIGRVKIFNTDPTILKALANSGLEVVVALTVNEIVPVGVNASAGDAWVQANVAPYYPATNIAVILLGNEIFSDTSLQSAWLQLVPAMQNIHTSLVNRGWATRIKVSTAVATDVLAASYPPSTGAFRSDIAVPVIQPLLKFLSGTHSYFFVNVYPFLAYTSSGGQISLNYALFGSSTNSVVDGGLTYTNLMDAQLDAVSAAMTKLGSGDVRLAIGETGWPTAGDLNEPGANFANAATYNRRLVRNILSTTRVGTPLRPGIFIPTFIFALFNENLKPGAGSERNWGLLYPNGSAVYAIDLTGHLSDSQYAPSGLVPVVATPPTSVSLTTPSTLAPASSTTAPPAQGSGSWCVTNAAADTESVETAMNYACSTNAADCTAIQPQQKCYNPNTVLSHASWAFNSYWQKYKNAGGTCNFGGAAMLSTSDPSFGSCVFPN